MKRDKKNNADKLDPDYIEDHYYLGNSLKSIQPCSDFLKLIFLHSTIICVNDATVFNPKNMVYSTLTNQTTIRTFS